MVQLEEEPELFQNRGPSLSAGGTVEQARAIIRSPLDTATPSRLPFGAARQLRRVVNRLLTHHDQQVNLRLEALAEAISQTGADIAGVSAQGAAESASTAARVAEFETDAGRLVGDLERDTRNRIADLSHEWRQSGRLLN